MSLYVFKTCLAKVEPFAVSLTYSSHEVPIVFLYKRKQLVQRRVTFLCKTRLFCKNDLQNYLYYSCWSNLASSTLLSCKL